MSDKQSICIDSNMCKSSETMQNLDEDNLPWDNFANWIHCICVVTFDLELGQAIENIYPSHINLTKQEIMNVCYLAFPDSNSGCMGDTNFTVRLQQSPGYSNLRKQHVSYNEKCPASLQIQQGYFWGYVYFRQVKDITLPRGYFQKSVVILSRLPFNNLFSKISSIISPEYFDNGVVTLEAACFDIEKWPYPTPGQTLNLPLLGTVFQVYVPAQCMSASCLSVIEANSSVSPFILASVAEVNIFEILVPVLSHVHMLWELVLTAEPMVIMATSPTNCSEMVVALTRLISPLKYCADYRPYFTIHDNEFKEFTSKSRGPPPVILGVTNPFFSKTLHHWPHTVRLCDNPEKHKFKIYASSPLAMGYFTSTEIISNRAKTDMRHVGERNSQKYKLKKNSSTKILDTSPGLYTSYKPYLHKDKDVIKKLLLGIHSKRPSEVQTALLRRHLLELTQSFIIPLERYIASLMPLQKNISPFKAAPTPLPFNPDDFLATLETAGPQLTSGVKGDWIGLYRRFFRSPNFNGWFNMRYKELALKLQALQLQALSDADLKNWVQGKPEVEVVDMVLKIKNKLNKLQDHDMPVTNETKEQLMQRLQDIMCTLPEDLKNILEIT